jgi:SAM-dependent methyltransferase
MASSAGFTGTVPGFYDRCLGPVLFEPYAADLVGRLPSRDGLRVLETACGTGLVTRRLREALPTSATLVATDLNEPMLSHAREAVGGPGITWRVADAQALPFADGSFDVVVCQFGLMFLPDKPRGLREARRVLALDGVLLANVWQSLDENPAVQAVQTVVDRFFPDDPTRFLDTPYGYHEQAQLHADLSEGGWADAHLEDVRLTGRGPSALDFATGFVRGSPLTHELSERGADLDVITSELTNALIPVGGDRPFEAQLAATVIIAAR